MTVRIDNILIQAQRLSKNEQAFLIAALAEQLRKAIDEEDGYDLLMDRLESFESEKKLSGEELISSLRDKKKGE